MNFAWALIVLIITVSDKLYKLLPIYLMIKKILKIFIFLVFIFILQWLLW